MMLAGSTDSDGTVDSYLWTQTEGPPVTLDDATAAQPTFTAPLVDAAGDTLVFSLVVTDNDGAASAPDTVQIIIENVVAGQEPGIVVEDTTTDTGRSIMSTRPVYAEYVGSDSVLVGKYIDSITVNLKKSDSATGTAYVGIINEDVTMKKVFAELDVSILPTGPYDPIEFILPTGDDYLIQADDRIGVLYTGTDGDYIAIMRDLTDKTDDGQFDGTNAHLTFYEGSWVTISQMSYDLTMTLELID